MDPGYTKWRGSLLQELIQTLMLISKEDHNAERISSEVSSACLFFSQIFPRILSQMKILIELCLVLDQEFCAITNLLLPSFHDKKVQGVFWPLDPNPNLLSFPLVKIHHSSDCSFFHEKEEIVFLPEDPEILS